VRPLRDRQCIHLGAQQTTDRFVRRTDNRFVFVEAGVAHDGDAGLLLDCNLNMVK